MKALLQRLKILSLTHLTFILVVWTLMLSGYFGFLLLDYQQQGELQYQQAQKDWLWLQSQQVRVVALRKHLPGKKESAMPIEQVVIQSAREKQLLIARQTKENGQLILELDDVSFNTLITWIAQLKQQYAINVLQLDLSELPDRHGNIKVKKLRLGRLMESVHVS